uniref:Uncharacterized protein n=1 Tax=Zea mays TaxID=4577 RepID=C0PNR0_MAIZE|nr:unknown [Zea mays]
MLIITQNLSCEHTGSTKKKIVDDIAELHVLTRRQWSPQPQHRAQL